LSEKAEKQFTTTQQHHPHTTMPTDGVGLGTVMVLLQKPQRSVAAAHASTAVRLYGFTQDPDSYTQAVSVLIQHMSKRRKRQHSST